MSEGAFAVLAQRPNVVITTILAWLRVEIRMLCPGSRVLACEGLWTLKPAQVDRD